jgi:pimeloyl-ACP methyl ester carboxylesterase
MDAPGLVRALVLVAASVDPELEETTWYQALARTWLLSPLVPSGLARADLELRPLRAELEDLRSGWAALRLPIRVLHGEDDGLVPVENADFVRATARAADVSVERMPDQGHLIPWQRPDRIAAAVRAALER